MKKILTILALAVLPCAVYAQGRVNFANASGFQISTNLTSVGGGVGFVDGVNTLKIGLYIAGFGSVNEANFIIALQDVALTPATATNRSGAFRGLFNGGNPFAIAGNNANPISFQVRAWSFQYADYAAAKVAWDAGTPGVLIGKSTIGTVTPATGATPTPNLFGVGAGQVAGFEVIPNVPEPSSIALGLLGLGAIAMFRRRK